MSVKWPFHRTFTISVLDLAKKKKNMGEVNHYAVLSFHTYHSACPPALYINLCRSYTVASGEPSLIQGIQVAVWV